jgi:small-conductance mechanosensitive channel/CRP-like cAMP-binding protein
LSIKRFDIFHWRSSELSLLIDFLQNNSSAHWHMDLVGTIIVAVVLQLLLIRALPDGRQLLRSNLMLVALCIVLSVGANLLPLIGLVHAADLMDEAAVVGWGLIFIRLCSLSIFRLLFPVVRIKAPRILQDIVFVLACIGWGLVRLRMGGLDLRGVVTTSAVITGIIAFSLQETLGNILGGLALQLDNSVRIGDWIHVDDVRGKVVEVHWRHTAVRTNNGEVIVIPNSLLMKSKVDVYSTPDKPQWRRWVRFSTGYAVPPQHVVGAIEKALRDARIEHVAIDPPPNCIVTDYRDAATHYAVRYWLTDPQSDDHVDSIVRLHIYACLQRQGHEFALARPCLDVSLTTHSERRNSTQLEEKIARRMKILSSVSLFSALNQEELMQIAASLREAIFTRNDVMTRQGAIANWLYLLTSGEADVWYEADGQERRHLATLKPGMVFGEMGMMTGEPRRATVIARTDAECYRIDKESFENILLARPALAAELALILTERNQELSSIHKENIKPDQMQQSKMLASIRQFFKLSY